MAKPRKAAAAPSGPKSLSDLTSATFAMLGGSPEASATIVDRGTLQRLVRGADLTTTRHYLAQLSLPQRVRAGGLVAAERESADEAKVLLTDAEASYATLLATHPHERRTALSGLVPAWWRLGEDEKAEAGLADYQTTFAGASPDHIVNGVVALAAQGGRFELVASRMAEVASGPETPLGLGPAIVACFAAGRADLAEALLARWSAAPNVSVDDELSDSLLREHIRVAAPDVHVALVRRFPTLLIFGVEALALLESADVARAVSVATSLVAEEANPGGMRDFALAILARHAPERAAEWASKHASLLDGFAPGVLAAAGRTDEARARLRPGMPGNQAAAVGRLTGDGALALEALTLATKSSPADAAAYGDLLLLGARDVVDASLDALLASITALPPAQREWPLVGREELAGHGGRVDIGAALVALNKPANRERAARGLAMACAGRSDIDGVFAALELIPSKQADRRGIVAVQALSRLGVPVVSPRAAR